MIKLQLFSGSAWNMCQQILCSRLISLSGSMVAPVASGLNPQDVRFLEMSKRTEGDTSRAGGLSRVSWSSHGIPSIRRQSRIAAMYTYGIRNSQRLTRNVGCSWAARCFRIVEIPLTRQRIRSVLWIPNLRQLLTRSRWIPLLLRKQFVNPQLSDSMRLLVTNSS